MTTATPRQALPRSCDPRKLANQEECFSLSIAVAALPRIVEATAEPTGEVKVELNFSRNHAHIPVVEGTLSAELALVCQRCLGSVVELVEVDVQVQLVKTDEQADAVKGDFEPWLVEDDTVDLHDLIEDELLLALPIVSYHEHDCAKWKPEVIEDAPRDEKENPFNVLKQLKK